MLTDRATLEPPASAPRLVHIDAATSYVHTLPDPPYVWRASSGREVAGDEDALARMAEPDFDPYGTVLLPAGVDAALASSESAATLRGTAVVLDRRPGEVVARTDGASPGWLVFSEMYYPGWRATVDGQPTEVTRANVALVAVSVPPGAHTVRLRFEAPLVRIGLAISIATAITLVGLATPAARPSRRLVRRGPPARIRQ